MIMAHLILGAICAPLSIVSFPLLVILQGRINRQAFSRISQAPLHRVNPLNHQSGRQLPSEAHLWRCSNYLSHLSILHRHRT